MPVSAILGRAPAQMRPFLNSPIDPARFCYFGIRVGDEGDWALQRELDLKLLDPEAAIEGPVHIHFELDVLDPREFPYLAYPDGNLGVEEAVALVSRIAREADLVSLTLTELLPLTTMKPVRQPGDCEALRGSHRAARLGPADDRFGRQAENMAISELWAKRVGRQRISCGIGTCGNCLLFSSEVELHSRDLIHDLSWLARPTALGYRRGYRIKNQKRDKQ
jgi:hypothetical protein